jgi:hypothetical protein
MSVTMHAGNHRGLDAYGHLRASCHHLYPRKTFLVRRPDRATGCRAA